MTYALIKTGSKQYRDQKVEVIDLELLEDKDGKIEFKEVLFLHNGKEGKAGAPLVKNAVVKGEVIDRVRGPKVIAYKYKQRKGNRRKVGHRQDYVRVKIVQLP